jgi:hypothetical protein
MAGLYVSYVFRRKTFCQEAKKFYVLAKPLQALLIRATPCIPGYPFHELPPQAVEDGISGIFPGNP